MAKNFAITIGINEYEHISRPLKYAASDAEKVRDFLLTEAGFNKVFYFSDNSPSIDNFSTRPTRASLLRLLKLRFEKEFLGAGDNFWFFFSGHGARVNGEDYIIPSDGFVEDVENSAISVNYIIQRLRGCGADNVVLILDACREQGDSLSKSIKGMGEQTEREAREKGVISICSCSPHEYSWELEELQQGAFTYALLEGLGSKGRKATVERLNEYLKYRVKELAQHKGKQTPRVMADPIEKSHLILMPKYATLNDISTLKIDAARAERRGKLQEAKSLWRRVVNAAQGADEDAIEALSNIAIQEKLGNFNVSPSPKSDNSENKSPKAEADPLWRTALHIAIGTGAIAIETLDTAIESLVSLSPKVELKSDADCDYTELNRLLSEGKWKEADGETARCMLQVAGRVEEGSLREEDIEKFPCIDLRTIDQLWVKYSNAKFGFSVQKKIYQNLGGTREYNDEVWEAFCNEVGWCQGGKWLLYSDLTFSLDTHYMGHLPGSVGTWGTVQVIENMHFRWDEETKTNVVETTVVSLWVPRDYYGHGGGHGHRWSGRQYSSLVQRLVDFNI